MLERLKQWKKDLEDLEKERIKQQAIVDQALDEIQKLGYAGLEEAKAALEELKTQKEKISGEAEALMSELESKYEKFIDPED